MDKFENNGSAKRVINFGAGPSMMPESVLRETQDAILNYKGLGFSILELNHRSSAFDEIRDELIGKVRSLLSVPDEFEILFCPGGGRMQFAMVPLNLCKKGHRGGYIVTGKWSEMAAAECAKVSRMCPLWQGSTGNWPYGEISVPDDVDYVYFCDNETVDGTEFTGLPRLSGDGHLFVADMSSNFMSRPIDFSRYAAIWAGVQKNFGAAGLSVLIVRRALLGNAPSETPRMLDWNVFFKTKSLPNTPPVLQYYVALLMARWVEAQGGVEEMNRKALKCSALLYKTIDEFPEMYVCEVPEKIRSRMNAVFTLKDETLIDVFVSDAAREGMINVAGHRSKGGLRVSIYNAMPYEAVEKLCGFMRDFAKRHAE